MVKLKIVQSVFITMLLASCSIRPLPLIPSTKDSTIDIVQNIRCEIAGAIRGTTSAYLRSVGEDDKADLIKSGVDIEVLLDDQKLDSEISATIVRYYGAAVGYEFTFNIVESNDLNGGVGLSRIFSRGPLTIGVEGTNNRSRQNVRNFKISDQFFKLARALPVHVCKTKRNLKKNGQYPITGSLGLSELVTTFLTLNQSGNLTGGDNGPTIADTLTFTTTISGSVAPAIELATVGTGLQIANAGVNVSAARTDIHQLVISLSLPPENVNFAEASTIAEQRAFAELERQRVITIDSDTEVIRDQLLSN